MPEEKAFSYDKRRVAEIRDLLARGESPYAYFTDHTKGCGQIVPDAGGKTLDHDANPVEVRRSLLREKALTAKWATIHTPYVDNEVYLDEDVFADVPSEQRIKQEPGKLYCSFCSVEVQEIRVTRGTGKLHTCIKTERVGSDALGRPVYQNRVIHFTEKQIACPDCCLEIKPTIHYNKETGEETGFTNNTRFPVMQG